MSGKSKVLEEEYDKNYEPSQEEIIEYATFLGMDAVADKDLFWIARESLKAPLPLDWKPCQTDDGNVYYFNFKSGESIWDHPCDGKYRAMFAEEKEKKVRKSQPIASPLSKTPKLKALGSKPAPLKLSGSPLVPVMKSPSPLSRKSTDEDNKNATKAPLKSIDSLSRKVKFDDDFDVSSASDIKPVVLKLVESDDNSSQTSEIKPIATLTKPNTQKNANEQSISSKEFEESKAQMDAAYSQKLSEYKITKDLEYSTKEKNVKDEFSTSLSKLQQQVQKILEAETELIANQLLFTFDKAGTLVVRIPENTIACTNPALLNCLDGSRKSFELKVNSMDKLAQEEYQEKLAAAAVLRQKRDQTNLANFEQEQANKSQEQLAIQRSEISAETLKLEFERDELRKTHLVLKHSIKQELEAETATLQEHGGVRIDGIKSEIEAQELRLTVQKTEWHKKLQDFEFKSQMRLQELEDEFRVKEKQSVSRLEKATQLEQTTLEIEQMELTKSPKAQRRSKETSESRSIINEEAQAEIPVAWDYKKAPHLKERNGYKSEKKHFYRDESFETDSKSVDYSAKKNSKVKEHRRTEDENRYRDDTSMVSYSESQSDDDISVHIRPLSQLRMKIKREEEYLGRAKENLNSQRQFSYADARPHKGIVKVPSKNAATKSLCNQNELYAETLGTLNSRAGSLDDIELELNKLLSSLQVQRSPEKQASRYTTAAFIDRDISTKREVRDPSVSFKQSSYEHRNKSWKVDHIESEAILKEHQQWLKQFKRNIQ